MGKTKVLALVAPDPKLGELYQELMGMHNALLARKDWYEKMATQEGTKFRDTKRAIFEKIENYAKEKYMPEFSRDTGSLGFDEDGQYLSYEAHSGRDGRDESGELIGGLLGALFGSGFLEAFRKK